MKSVKKKLNESSGEKVNANKKEKDKNKLIGTSAVQVDSVNNKKVEEKDALEIEGGKESEKKVQEENPIQPSGGIKSGKKKIIKKRIVRQKVSDKNSVAENSTAQSDKLEDKDVGEKNSNSEVADQLAKSSASPAAAKTLIKKKIAKKIVKKIVQKGNAVQPELISGKEPEGPEGSKGKLDSGSAAGLQDASVKLTVKKKIIKRVPKRKASALGTGDVANKSAKDVNNDGAKLTQAENDTKPTGDQTTDASNQGKQVESENKPLPKMNLKQASEKQDNMGSSSKKSSKAVEGKTIKEPSSISIKEVGTDEKTVNQKDGHAGRNEKSSEREKLKAEKERKDKDGKDETKNKSNRDVKEKKKPEEPPRHPGLFLCTKGSKNLKVGYMTTLLIKYHFFLSF